MRDLTDPLAALELVHSLLSKTTDTLTQEEKNTSSTGKTRVSVHTDTALTPTDTPPPSVSAVSALSVHALTQENAVQDANIAPSVSASVHLGDRGGIRRDPDPSGCPTHWQRVPLLPPKGERVALVDEGGHGRLYRFKHERAWYLVKFLPPFDGRLSLTDEAGVVRVLASLEEVARFLSALEPVPYIDL